MPGPHGKFETERGLPRHCVEGQAKNENSPWRRGKASREVQDFAREARDAVTATGSRGALTESSGHRMLKADGGWVEEEGSRRTQEQRGS